MVTLNHNRFQARSSDRVPAWGGVRKSPLFAFLVPHFSARVVVSGKPWSKRKFTTALTHQNILCEITGLPLHRETKEAEGFHGNPRLRFFFFIYGLCI